ncbi:hypothetical protein IAG25_10845 [Caballeronia sp. EK]|uniref:hypothetical protein n=1 Tax=Caballeronia sp. EK TaxID=2767469 RepID=UPI0016557E7E|nr:hypothetical protein [Caballeronia sp. EK]MBC8637309.1 hypothetical protein [Caballeronia sp. EK]
MNAKVSKILMAGIAGLLALGLIAQHRPASGPKEAAPSAPEIAAVVDASATEPAAVPPPSREYILAEDSGLLERAAKHLTESKEKLKKYYGSVDDLNRMNSELTDVRAVILRHTDGDKQEQDVARRAKGLEPQMAQQVRALYASSLEEIFIKNGFDIKVKATGTELRLTYALMSKPLVYKFANEWKLADKAADYGFTRLVYTNGFSSSLGETWTEHVPG